MLDGILERLRGQVRLRAECAFPERILNLCGARGLSFWDVRWESPTAFTCWLGRRDYQVLRQAAKNLECTLTVLERAGAPYFLRRFRHRTALVTGLVSCALGLFIGSFFIWDFTVEGNVTVPTEEILRALQRNGVELGTFGLSLDGDAIRNHVLLEIPDLSWIAVNVSGCRANVQVRERVHPPERVDRQTPANVVARRPGLVLKVRSDDGVAAVMEGTSVAEGQLLISGVEDTDTVGARVVSGMGTVTARTWYSLSAVTPLTVTEKRYTGEEKTLFSLVLGTRRIKFFSNSSIEGADYDKMTSRRPLSLLGISLPVTLETEVCRFYEPVARQRGLAEAEEAAGRALASYLEETVSPYGTVSSTLCTSRQRGDDLVVTLTAECQEEIGVRVPLYTDTKEAGGGPP